MATFTKEKLSASTYGFPVQITGVTGPGTTIHASLGSATTLDEVWLWAINTTGTPVKLTVCWGGTGTDRIIEVMIPAEAGLVMIAPGLLVTGDGQAGNVISAFAGTGSVINITGYVNRITP